MKGYNGIIMVRRNQRKLVTAYKKYSAGKNHNVLGFFRVFMPEIIFRTTRLENEPITRKKVSTLFK